MNNNALLLYVNTLLIDLKKFFKRNSKVFIIYIYIHNIYINYLIVLKYLKIEKIILFHIFNCV